MVEIGQQCTSYDEQEYKYLLRTISREPTYYIEKPNLNLMNALAVQMANGQIVSEVKPPTNAEKDNIFLNACINNFDVRISNFFFR